MCKLYALGFLVFINLGIGNVFAFELDLKSRLGNYSEEGLLYKNTKTLKGKGKPVHENLVVRSVMLSDLKDFTFLEKEKLIKDIVIGVRWNDDPLNMLREHLLVGGLSFYDSCKKNTSKKIDVYWDLFYRSHCGDMQFLHSMASSKNESAEDTYNKMISWFEFTYRVSTGAIPLNLKYRSLHYRMSEANAETFKKIIIAPKGGRSTWRASGMFSMDCTRTTFTRNIECEQKKYSISTTRNIALGSLLHILQDSYSKSHVGRDKEGRLASFGLYNFQNKKMHASKDKGYDDKYVHDLIDMSSKIINMVMNDRKNKYPFYERVNLDTDSWEIVKKNFIDPIIRPVNMNAYPSDLGLGKN